MTDRRASVNLEHEHIQRQVDSLKTELTDHIHPEIEEIATELLGPRLPGIEGDGRDTTHSIKHVMHSALSRLDKLESLGRESLTKTDRFTLYIAAAGVAVAVWQGFQP